MRGRRGDIYYLATIVHLPESLIIVTILPMMLSYFLYNSFAVVLLIYLHSNANSIHTWVSAHSASASLSFDIKDFSYLRFLNASAIFAHIERDERRI